MHDVGKPYCVAKFGNMHGHERVSAHIVRYTLGEYGLKYPQRGNRRGGMAVRQSYVRYARNTKEAKLRIFVATNFERIDKLVALMEADNRARGMDDEPRENRLAATKKKLIEEGAPITLADLKLDGSVLIREGIQPVKIGGLLEELWRTCVVNPSLNTEDWLLARVKKFSED